MIQTYRAMNRNLMTQFFFSSLQYSRKPRQRKDPVTSNNNPSPPPPTNDSNNAGLVTTHENSHPSSIPSNTSTPIHSSSSSSNNSTLLYLQPQYAILTRSLAECNIHVLIDQPRGVDKNEWIANNSTINLFIFSNKTKSCIDFIFSCRFF